MTSEKMNQAIPCRKDLSIWALYSPVMDSWMMWRNQPNSMKTSKATPAIIR
ncbi:hypothetical protein D3C85_1519940 [compost metagenome]